MGFWSWILHPIKSYRQREAEELGVLLSLFEADKRDTAVMEEIVQEMQRNIIAGNRTRAEQMMPRLVRLIKTKKILEAEEIQEFGLFKKTILKQLKRELKGGR